MKIAIPPPRTAALPTREEEAIAEEELPPIQMPPPVPGIKEGSLVAMDEKGGEGRAVLLVRSERSMREADTSLMKRPPPLVARDPLTVDEFSIMVEHLEM